MTDASLVKPPSPGEEVVESAPAKVNLFVHVTGRRDDGYHLLDSLAVFPAVGDTVRVAAAAPGECSLRIEGPFAHALDAGDDNLVMRAVRALARAAGVPAQARLVLEKFLPVASGIGGGSADAAATLRALARLWGVRVASGLAEQLGADVPVCMASVDSRMMGVGEQLTAAPRLPPCGMVLLNPGVEVSTKDVFAARSQPFSPPAQMPEEWRDTPDFVGWLAGLRNDLQSAAEAICPAITPVLTALRATNGCLLTRMSGSGATCFGLFETPALARAAAASLAAPGWWGWGGAIAGLPRHADAT